MKIDKCEVRPCPYCGSDNLKIQHLDGYWVSCCDCWAQGPDADNAVTAVLKWNSVYPALDTDFADVFLKALANERNKKTYDSDDIEWIREKVKAMKVNVCYILDQIIAILGGPGNEDQ